MGPDNIRSQQRDPSSFLLDFSEHSDSAHKVVADPSYFVDAWFDFLANVPESQHAGMMLLSDHATPDGNHFSAYGCHTFRWVNQSGEAVYIKVSTMYTVSSMPILWHLVVIGSPSLSADFCLVVSLETSSWRQTARFRSNDTDSRARSRLLQAKIIRPHQGRRQFEVDHDDPGDDDRASGRSGL